MSRIDPEEVREIARLARVRLSANEVARMARELDAILTHIEDVRQVDTEGVLPMTHAVPFDCPLREDTVGEMLTVDETLRNAPRREGSFFAVPRVMPETGRHELPPDGEDKLR
jgi:aspartyl-tRNA(Asn)/glutamyl-tRNA(Gln) amidotransferase subunit C